MPISLSLKQKQNKLCVSRLSQSMLWLSLPHASSLRQRDDKKVQDIKKIIEEEFLKLLKVKNIVLRNAEQKMHEMSPKYSFTNLRKMTLS